MNATNFVPGRYVRSATEAEQNAVAERGPTALKIVLAMRRSAIDSREVLAARVAIELCRRGYTFAWDACLRAAQGTFPGEVRQLDVGEIAEIMIATNVVAAEEDRERAAQSWSEIAVDAPGGDDWYDAELDSRPHERKARDRRFFGMQNRAMRDKLERGECVDVSAFRMAGSYYVIPDDVFQDVDFCDISDESWIWSIGRHKVTRELHASTTAELYQNPDYECVWLR